MWAVSLFRLQWLGMAFAWEGGHALNDVSRPHVAAYARSGSSRAPSVRAAIIDWPGVACRSEHSAAVSCEPRARGRRSPPRRGSDRGSWPRHPRGEPHRRRARYHEGHAEPPRPRCAQRLHPPPARLSRRGAAHRRGMGMGHRVPHPDRASVQGRRQEFILLSDVMGATARVDLINNRFPSGATENSVLGPFFVDPRPSFENGADISGGVGRAHVLQRPGARHGGPARSPAPGSISGMRTARAATT
jgi:hypothetical protein